MTQHTLSTYPKIRKYEFDRHEKKVFNIMRRYWIVRSTISRIGLSMDRTIQYFQDSRKLEKSDFQYFQDRRKLKKSAFQYFQDYRECCRLQFPIFPGLWRMLKTSISRISRIGENGKNDFFRYFQDYRECWRLQFPMFPG